MQMKDMTFKPHKIPLFHLKGCKIIPSCMRFSLSSMKRTCKETRERKGLIMLKGNERGEE